MHTPLTHALLKHAESSKALKIIAQSIKISILDPLIPKSPLAKIILMCYVCSFL